MKRYFLVLIIFLGALLLLQKPVLAGNDQNNNDHGDDHDIFCIPNPFPPGWKILHKDWDKLHLPPCKENNPPPPPPPPPPPSGGGGGSSSNNSGGGGGGGGSNCGDPKPSSAPTLTGVSNLGGGKMQLWWTSVSPVTHYALAYGPESGKYIYGATDVGNVTNYIVASLVPGQSYCFVVSAVNGCTASGFSNEKCSGQVLGASTVGQVLGLSFTASDNRPTQLAFAFFGLLCVMSGVYLRKLKVA